MERNSELHITSRVDFTTTENLADLGSVQSTQITSWTFATWRETREDSCKLVPGRTSTTPVASCEESKPEDGTEVIRTNVLQQTDSSAEARLFALVVTISGASLARSGESYLLIECLLLFQGCHGLLELPLQTFHVSCLHN